LALAIDHYGKQTETGIRGSSAKSAAADAILACLGERDNEGVVSNHRLAVTKLRNGPTGRVIPFELRQTETQFGACSARRASAATSSVFSAPASRATISSLHIEESKRSASGLSNLSG
jgi:hypothetical protein